MTEQIKAELTAMREHRRKLRIESGIARIKIELSALAIEAGESDHPDFDKLWNAYTALGGN